MREIKFRGLNAKNEWRYGYLLKDSEGETTYYDEYSYRIVWYEGHAHCNQPVKNGTIGQFTGLKDKNGVEIYEGDIIKTHAIIGYGKREKQVEVISQVIFYLSDRFTMSGYPTNETPKFSTRQLNKQDWREVPWSMFYQCEVIGNIYENKELLGE